jgi:hypothetical protein
MRGGTRTVLEMGSRVNPRCMNIKVRFTILAVALAALVIAPAATATGTTYDPVYKSASAPTPAACKSVDTTHDDRWQPRPTTSPWQWQLQGKIDTGVPACVYDVDDFETSKATVTQLHEEGVKVICYVDAGSWEEYRPDAGQFPKSSLGERYEGWPEERWLDIAHFHKFASIMEARIEQCAEKGFDAVEPDNIAGFENKTGFPLTGADQLRYNLWIARQVHQRGMAVALKNDPSQVKELVGHFDFAIVEECFQYHECGLFKPFIEAGKAVYEAEYELPPKKFCAKAKALDFSAVRKGLELFDKPWKPCGRLSAEG